MQRSVDAAAAAVAATAVIAQITVETKKWYKFCTRLYLPDTKAPPNTMSHAVVVQYRVDPASVLVSTIGNQLKQTAILHD